VFNGELQIVEINNSAILTIIKRGRNQGANKSNHPN
jgi:hypothetical protein